MNERKNQGDFVVQAGILAGAGIIVRIIGILYRSPLTSIIGDEGNGYYGAAYNIYTIILLLASYSIMVWVRCPITMQGYFRSLFSGSSAEHGI